MLIEVNVPDGVSGDWSVQTFEVTENDSFIHNLRSAFNPQRGNRRIVTGFYKKLCYRGDIVMSNTPAEVSDHLSFIYEAKRTGGSVLINGLGLGMVLTKVLEFDNVERISVVEISQDVLDLVSPSFDDERIHFIKADALHYSGVRGEKYTAVWHDIWESICGDNIDEMKTLHRKYGSKTDWQGSWCRNLCEASR